MGYRWPTGKHAEQEASRIVFELKIGLGATFHRFLSGELGRKRTGIFVNGEPVEPWDPFCRAHKTTDTLPPFEVAVSYGKQTERIVFRPFVLPVSKSFSSPTEFIRAGGLKKWNKQQGFYIYRAGRLIQSGGWSGLRTADEHTKLVRIAVDIPSEMDDAFKVNISKMKVSIPREVRALVLEHLASVIKTGQEKYRSTSDEIVTKVAFGIDHEQLGLFARDFDLSGSCAAPFAPSDIADCVPVCKPPPLQSNDVRMLLDNGKMFLRAGAYPHAFEYFRLAQERAVNTCGILHADNAEAYAELAKVVK